MIDEEAKDSEDDDAGGIIGMIEVDVREPLVEDVCYTYYAYPPEQRLQLTQDPIPMSWHSGGSLRNLFVIPAHRRRGVATHLVQHALNHLEQEWNYMCVNLRGQVSVYNAEALRFFDNVGWYGSFNGKDNMVYVLPPMRDFEPRPNKSIRPQEQYWAQSVANLVKHTMLDLD